MNKHIAGPWEIRRTASNPGALLERTLTTVKGNGAMVCMIYDVMQADDEDTRSTIEANAALIAAAPDLLSALEACLDRYATGYNKDDNEAVAARAAIAKARGEA